MNEPVCGSRPSTKLVLVETRHADGAASPCRRKLRPGVVVGKHGAFAREDVSGIFQEDSESHLRSALRFGHRSYVRVTGLAKPL